MRKSLLITGASSGLGIATAIQAAGAGYSVHATMRDPGKRAALDQAAAAAGVKVQVHAMDVCDPASVAAAVAAVIATEGQIDALVANAGIGFVRTTEQATAADIDLVMQTNFMGVVHCVKSVLPHMRQARHGHIVAISSVGGLVGQPFNEIYCASKFAVEGYIESLATYVGPAFGLQFSLVEPGGILSEFANSALRHFNETGGMIEDEYLPVIGRYMAARQNRADGIFQTADQVAGVVVACLQSATPPLRVRTSDWAEKFCALKTVGDPDGLALRAQVVSQMLGGMD